MLIRPDIALIRPDITLIRPDITLIRPDITSGMLLCVDNKTIQYIRSFFLAYH